jgi:hypothetical protein
MALSLADALAALEFGHLEPKAEDLTGMAPPPSEALEQTITAIWSDLFTTLNNSSLERDIEDLGWGVVNLAAARSELRRLRRRGRADPGRDQPLGAQIATMHFGLSKHGQRGAGRAGKYVGKVEQILVAQPADRRSDLRQGLQCTRCAV